VIVTGVPTQQTDNRSISDSPDGIGETARNGISQRTERKAGSGALSSEWKWNCCCKPQISAQDLVISDPADGRDIDEEIRFDVAAPDR
jgi:hypothetical protein